MDWVAAVGSRMDWVAWVAVVGAVGTLGFGIWAIRQNVQDRVRRAARDAHAAHLVATIQQLQIVRAMLTEAVSLGEVFNVDTDKAIIRTVAHDLQAAETHLCAVLGFKEEEISLPAKRIPKILPPLAE